MITLQTHKTLKT